MAVNKVVYNRRTLIDLTADTVSKETLKKGFTAHQADGTMITGEFIGDDYDEIDRILTAGLTDGYKHFSDDGTIISTIDSQGRTLVKTFSNDFLTCTTVLTDPDGVELGRTVKSFSDNSSTIITTDSKGQKLVKKFSNNMLNMEAVLTDAAGKSLPSYKSLFRRRERYQFDRSLWKIRCDLKPSRVGYFCIIPTLWFKKPVITGYFASIIETYHSLITSKSLQLRCFQSG